MDNQFFRKERDFWLNGLMEDMIPFWLKYSRDKECGGYYGGLRRDGSVYDKEKTSSWTMGRNVWAFSYLYNHLREDPEWLAYVQHGVRFMKQHTLDEDGHTWGALTCDGKPLARSSDVYHDLYTAQAFGQASKAIGDAELLEIAKRLTVGVSEITFDPRNNPFRPYLSEVTPWSSHPEYLILLETIQYLRDVDDDPIYDDLATKCVEKILQLHYKEDLKAVLELVGLNAPLDPWLRYWVCPGHLLEFVWLVIYEGQHQGKDEYIDKAVTACDWAMQWGWDEEYGGIRNDINIKGEYSIAGPSGHYSPHGPLKMWWTMCEAVHSNLLAYIVSGENRFKEWYEKARDWAFEHYADKEYGEWYGVLSPEGKLLDGGAKATDIKMAQHTLRSFYFCYRNAAHETKKS